MGFVPDEKGNARARLVHDLSGHIGFPVEMMVVVVNVSPSGERRYETAWFPLAL